MRYIKQFIIIFSLVTITIAILNAMVVPPKAEAYYSNDYNFRFNGQSSLSNGYAVKIIGVGFMKYSGLSVFTSGNLAVEIRNVKGSKSKFLGVKLIHNTSAYGIPKLDITAPFVNVSKDLIAECKKLYCELQSSHMLKGIFINPQVSVRAELVFDTGTYTVWTSQVKRQQ